jgi:hypothetical protein
MSPNQEKTGKEVEFEDTLIFKLDSKRRDEAGCSPTAPPKSRARHNAIQNDLKGDPKTWAPPGGSLNEPFVAMGSYRGTLWVSRLNNALPTSPATNRRQVRSGSVSTPEGENDLDHVEKGICGQPTLITSKHESNALSRWLVLPTDGATKPAREDEDAYVRNGDSIVLAQDWTCLASYGHAAVLKRKGKVTQHKMHNQTKASPTGLRTQGYPSTTSRRPRTSGSRPIGSNSYKSSTSSKKNDAGQHSNSSMEWRVVVLAGSHDDDLRPAEIRLVHAREQVLHRYNHWLLVLRLLFRPSFPPSFLPSFLTSRLYSFVAGSYTNPLKLEIPSRIPSAGFETHQVF